MAMDEPDSNREQCHEMMLYSKIAAPLDRPALADRYK
jgi:hypothetical protein